MDKDLEVKNLWRECENRYRLGSHAENLRAAQDAWVGLLKDSATAESGEVCRLAMLAVFKQRGMAEGELWRVRALSRFIRSESHTGVALIILSCAFAANGGIKKTESERDSILAIFDEMESHLRLAEQTHKALVPTLDECHRMIHEKRGFFLFESKQLQKAKAEYLEALKFVDADPCGRWKVQAGLANCLYWLGEVQEANEKLEEALENTEDPALKANMATNLEAMRNPRQHVQLEAYEIL
jgi:tetratricopeptide (TPR) repeat protein